MNVNKSALTRDILACDCVSQFASNWKQTELYQKDDEHSAILCGEQQTTYWNFTVLTQCCTNSPKNELTHCVQNRHSLTNSLCALSPAIVPVKNSCRVGERQQTIQIQPLDVLATREWLSLRRNCSTCCYRQWDLNAHWSRSVSRSSIMFSINNAMPCRERCVRSS